jgi:hypothetical protein
VAGYIVHDTDNQKPEGGGSTRRRPGWKLPLICGIVLVAFSVALLALAFDMPQVLGSSAEGAESAVEDTPALTEARIQAALQDLSWQGEDIGLDPSAATVTLEDGKVSVVVTDDGAAADAVPLAAKRLLALEQWLEDEAGPDDFAVSWSVNTSAGAQVFDGTLDAGAAPATDVQSTEELLSSLSSYTLSDAAWQDLGLADVPEQGGSDSSNAEGSASGQSGNGAQGNGGEEGKGSSGISNAGSSSSESSSSAGAAGGAGSGSTGTSSQTGSGTSGNGASTSPSAAAEPSQITVSVSVDASLGGGSSTSVTVTVPQGSSVLDALEAAGYGVSTQNTQYGIYITGIGGVEASSRDRRGWVYAVNGVEPSYSAANYALSSGDSIAWAYVSY